MATHANLPFRLPDYTKLRCSNHISSNVGSWFSLNYLHQPRRVNNRAPTAATTTKTVPRIGASDQVMTANHANKAATANTTTSRIRVDTPKKGN